jgi:hypothetical protein
METRKGLVSKKKTSDISVPVLSKMWIYNRNYSAILATLQITSYVDSRNSS